MPMVCPRSEPHSKTFRLAIGAIDDRHIPVLEYREPASTTAWMAISAPGTA